MVNTDGNIRTSSKPFSSVRSAISDMPKRKSLMWCVFVLMGWLGTSLLFSYVWFKSATSPHIPSATSSSTSITTTASTDSVFSDRNSVVIKPPTTTTKSPLLIKSAHYVERMLPTFSKSSSHAKRYDNNALQIFLDWPLDDKLFTRENYLSLESLLVTYPDAKVRVLLPTSRDAYTQKNGNLFSTNQFVQYQKRGYDIEVTPVGRMEQSLGPGFGEAYWSRWSQICCQQCSSTCRRSDRVQPFHLMTFLRLCKLWRRGGIAADFSYLFLGPIPTDALDNASVGGGGGAGSLRRRPQGYFFHSSCSNRDNKEEWQEEQEAEVEEDKAVAEKYSPDQPLLLSWKGSRCMTSSMFVFSVRKSPVIECILRQYDNSSFVQCIENDRVEKGGFEGAACLEHVFASCFAAHDVTNLFTPAAVPQPSSSSSGSSAVPDSSQQLSILETFSQVSPHDLPLLFTSASFPWSVRPVSRVLYMGQVAREGSWKQWEARQQAPGEAAAGGVRGAHNSSLLSTLKTRVDEELLRAPFEERADCSLRCARYTQRPHGLTIGQLTKTTTGSAPEPAAKHSYHTGIEAASCAPYVVVTGFVQGGAQTLSSLLTSHPQALPPLGGGTPPADRKADSGAGVSGPGSGSDWGQSETYDSINSYASCYRSDTSAKATQKWKSLMRRPWCFPFIDSRTRHSSSSRRLVRVNASSPSPSASAKHSSTARASQSQSQSQSHAPVRRGLSRSVLNVEVGTADASKASLEDRVGFFSVDRDVRYATDVLAPYSMLADNPAMKIIFAVRNPIERMYYHYLLLSRYYPDVDFNKVVEYGLAKHGKFGKLRRLLSSKNRAKSESGAVSTAPAANYDSIIQAYFTPASLFGTNLTAAAAGRTNQHTLNDGTPDMLLPGVRKLKVSALADETPVNLRREQTSTGAGVLGDVIHSASTADEHIVPEPVQSGVGQPKTSPPLPAVVTPPVPAPVPDPADSASSSPRVHASSPESMAAAASAEDIRIADKPVARKDESDPQKSLGSLTATAKKRMSYTINTYDNLAPQRQLQTMADILFTHSIYFPSILHYGRIMGNSNLMVVNMESRWGPLSSSSAKDWNAAGGPASAGTGASAAAAAAVGDLAAGVAASVGVAADVDDEKTQYAHRLQRVATQVYRFAGLCSHEMSPQALAEAVRLSPDLQSSSAQFQSFDSNDAGKELPTHVNKIKISRRTLHRLVTFFRPFNIELSRIIGQDLRHWNNESSFASVHQRFMDTDAAVHRVNGTSTAFDASLAVPAAAMHSNWANVSHVVDWFDEEGKELLRQHLVQEEAALLLLEEGEDISGSGDREWGLGSIGGLLAAGEELLNALLPPKSRKVPVGDPAASAEEKEQRSKTIGMFAVF